MRVRDVATEATLARCVAHAKRRHPRPDAVLLTGDLVHDDAGGYAMLRERFGDTAAPVHCLPGNHDDPAAVKAALDAPPFVHDFARRYGHWMIVMMDSTVAGIMAGTSTRRSSRGSTWRSRPSRAPTRSCACITTRCRTAAHGSTS